MASEGVYWTPAHKDVGSQQNGWELLRERLKNVMKPDGPRLFVFNTCRRFIWTVPGYPATRTIVAAETNGKRRIIGQSLNMAHGQSRKRS